MLSELRENEARLKLIASRAAVTRIRPPLSNGLKMYLKKKSSVFVMSLNGPF